MANEQRRYERAGNLRVESVETANRFKPEKLYAKRFDPDKGFAYSRSVLPRQKFDSVEAALEALRPRKQGGRNG